MNDFDVAVQEVPAVAVVEREDTDADAGPKEATEGQERVHTAAHIQEQEAAAVADADEMTDHVVEAQGVTEKAGEANETLQAETPKPDALQAEAQGQTRKALDAEEERQAEEDKAGDAMRDVQEAEKEKTGDTNGGAETEFETEGDTNGDAPTEIETAGDTQEDLRTEIPKVGDAREERHTIADKVDDAQEETQEEIEQGRDSNEISTVVNTPTKRRLDEVEKGGEGGDQADGEGCQRVDTHPESPLKRARMS